jgi:hypothetical protein
MYNDNDNVISFGMTVFIITLSIVLLLSASITITQHHQAFARCPNGFHKSPNGTCEQVTSSPKAVLVGALPILTKMIIQQLVNLLHDYLLPLLAHQRQLRAINATKHFRNMSIIQLGCK